MTHKKSFSTLFILFSLSFLMAFNALDEPMAGSNTKKITQLESGAYYQTSPCWFTSEKKNISCGWLHTAPEKGKKRAAFKLPVVVFRYQGNDRKDDPIVFLAGGPGAGAWLDADLITSYWQNTWDNELSHLKRDLVLFDQRGSGLSLPKVRCPSYKNHALRLLTQPDTPVKNAQYYREATHACWQNLKQQGIAVSQLATHYSAKDVADIMQALHYPIWNIQGVSYGTRLGIEVQRRYPDKVRTLTLDSVYPPSAHLFQDWPMLLNDSLLRIFEHCALNEVCSASADEFETRFWALMQKLKKQPLKFTIDRADIELDSMILNDETLLAVLFHAEYRTNVLSYLTEALFHLEKNDTTAFQNFVEEYVLNQLDDSFSDAVYWAVECHDNPQIDSKKYTFDDAHYKKLKHYLPEDNDVCEIWNQDYQYIALNTQNVSITPVLIFSGEDDPITPTDWAIDAAAAFDNNAYLFSFYNVSHSVMDHKYCTNKLYKDFINTPDKRPRADCRRQESPNMFANTDIVQPSVDTQDVVATATDQNELRLPN